MLVGDTTGKHYKLLRSEGVEIGHESLEGGFVILGYVDKANDAIVEQTALDDL